MTLEAIKDAISNLREEDKASLVAWLKEQDAEAWDKELEQDFSEGERGAALIEKWDAEIKSGKSLPLEEFLVQRESGSKNK
jgi:hypothetical protein